MSPCVRATVSALFLDKLLQFTSGYDRERLERASQMREDTEPFQHILAGGSVC